MYTVPVSEVYQQITKQLQNGFPKHVNITARTHFSRDLGLDSMEVAAFLMDVEQIYNIRIRNSDFHHLNSVEKVVEYVRKTC